MCNAAVLRFLHEYQQVCQPDFDILEVGSRDINGTSRTLFQPLARNYIGVDLVPGDGVDQIVDACQLSAVFDCDQFDMVISTEMLEHCLDWRAAIYQMKTVLKPQGYLLLTTRSPGFGRHNEPDHWRFTRDHILHSFADFDILALVEDDQEPGIFIAAEKPVHWAPMSLSHIIPYIV